MKDIYYVQTQARRILKCIYPEDLPQGNVCSEYLAGISQKLFLKAVTELRNIFRDFYSRAEKEPALLNLPLAEIENYKYSAPEVRNSSNALLNFPVALLSLAACSEYAENSLCADISETKKLYAELKRKYLPEQLCLLSEYGFSFGGFDGKKLPKAGTLNITYPDNPALLVVLAALGDKFTKHKAYYLQQPKSCVGLSLFEQFIYIMPAVYADSSELLPEKSIEHMSAFVGTENGVILARLAEKLGERGFSLRFDEGFLKNRFFNSKGKDTMLYVVYGDYRSFHPFYNEKLSFRLKLNNPDAYTDKIEALPPHLYKAFAEVWCGNCAEACNRKIRYSLKGEEKCACGCFFFAFEPRSEGDLDLLLELYDAELNKRGGK